MHPILPRPSRPLGTSLLLLLAVIALPATLLAEPPPSTGAQAKPIFQWLDEGNDEELLKIKPKTLLKAITKGRRFKSFERGEQRIDLEDGFGRETRLHLFVPKKPSGVLLLLHGLGGSGRQLMPHYQSWAEQNGLIIAAPSAKKLGKVKNEDWNSTAEQLQHWFSYREEGFTMRALAELKRRYPFDENRVFISGYSMGGFTSWNLAMRFPDRFAAAAPIAGGISQREYQIDTDEELRPLLWNLWGVPMYILHGSSDQTVPASFDQQSRDQLRSWRYPHEYKEVSGAGHILDVRAGTPLMRGLQSYLQKKRRDPNPKEIRFHSLGPSMPQAYWLRIEEFVGDEPARVTAKIGKKNRIEIESEGAKRLTVFIDEKHIKLSRKITVVWNGTEVFDGKVKASTETILQSWRAKEDRSLLYSASIPLSIAEEEPDPEEKKKNSRNLRAVSEALPALPLENLILRAQESR